MRDLDKKKEYQHAYYLKNKEKLMKYQREWYKRNKEFNNERIRQWSVNNKEARRRNILKSEYNITLEQYDGMFQEQQGQCAICKTHQSKFTKRLHVDHCHTTGEVRGLLCSKCNSALGFANDDPELLQNMIQYLKNERCTHIYKGTRKVEQVGVERLRQHSTLASSRSV